MLPEEVIQEDENAEENQLLEENNNIIEQPQPDPPPPPPPLLNPVQVQLHRYQEQVAALAAIADAEESFLGVGSSKFSHL